MTGYTETHAILYHDWIPQKHMQTDPFRALVATFYFTYAVNVRLLVIHYIHTLLAYL